MTSPRAPGDTLHSVGLVERTSYSILRGKQLGLWAARAGRNPSLRDFDERVVRERRSAARSGMRICTRRPSPDHQRRLDVGYPLTRRHGAAHRVC